MGFEVCFDYKISAKGIRLLLLFLEFVLLAVGGEDAGVIHAPVLHDGLAVRGSCPSSLSGSLANRAMTIS